MTNPKFSTDATTRITSAVLTPDQLDAALCLGGPHEVAGVTQVALDGESLWGHLGGQAVTGLRLGARVYPTYADATRAWEAIALGENATAAQIDRIIADREEGYADVMLPCTVHTGKGQR